MNIITILYSAALYFLIWLCIYVLTSKLRSRKSAKLPPGPFQFPIIGNLHQISKKPHQSFAKLSKTYGPLMSVRLGRKHTIIVSSAEVAREVLQKNDSICSTRSVPNAAETLDHNKFSMAWLPPSTQWRNMRKMCREQVFSTQRLDSSQSLRQEKLKELRDYVNSCSNSWKSVEIGEAAFITSLNLMSRTLFSVDFANYDSDSTQELRDAVWGVMKNVGAPNLSDYFPVLRLIDPQGIMRSARTSFQNLFDIFDRLINERKLVVGGSSEMKKNDLLEALLDENIKNESEFSIDVLKHLLLDLFVAGIDTTSSTVEWAMAELLRSPKWMEKVRKELKQVIGEEGVVQESDISRLPDLQAVVKETFRLHPAAPFLVPHKATEDVEINGYTVPKNTEILVNAYAVGRDERTWSEPEMFKPERFLDSEIDVKGKHFELIPFGGGRRICPGLPLAYRMVHLMLASLIHNIDWKLEGEIRPQDLDMDEMFGLTIQKALPLKAIPLKL
ncbi:OLC1v1038999C1 [Oldenlandia corymbosa var. corymbosa]|uniref:OLC1v1038999C1 n=1 Tax=Oldenlandia corymbosa var. corymbosa TaxID=529605 RepID=A0AAV1D2N8_OLDCO|nr:OLC1v1038999C1 [Oldenlandia corymbosa var. corymbosa]